MIPMKTPLEKEIKRVKKQEVRQGKKQRMQLPMKDKVYQKVPQGLRDKLEAAFVKAFELVFLKGTGVIEKTFDKEQINLQYEANNYIIDKTQNKKTLRNLDQSAKKHTLGNHVATSVSGLAMGFIGLGLPDIPVMVTTMLKGLYEIALGYGFSYEQDQEKVYILRLIRAALADVDEKQQRLWEVDHIDVATLNISNEVRLCAKDLSDALLVEKFIQGIPLIGIIGGFVNHQVYSKTTKLATIKYKQRYLLGKVEEVR